VIPHGLTGGPHVIIMAFQQWHQALVNAWSPHLERISAEHPGMEVWEVPSISKGYRLFMSGIDSGMRADIPDPDVRRHTPTAYTDLNALARPRAAVAGGDQPVPRRLPGQHPLAC
jgi:hypothetical protein